MTTDAKGPHKLLLLLALLLGPLSVLEPRLSIFAVLLLVIALASLSRLGERQRRPFALSLGVTLTLAVLGLGRFVLHTALPGIVGAAARASGGRAVSVLREILFAQDASRRLALIDPDGDGVGGAGRLGELTGVNEARGKIRLETPPLAPYLTPRVPTPRGSAAEEADFLYLVCVPGKDGKLTARDSDEVDEEAAERRFVAYAWPARETSGQTSAFFIDEHERILVSENRATTGERKLRLVGPGQAPECDDALTSGSARQWQTWRNKEPRRSLPGLPEPPNSGDHSR